MFYLKDLIPPNVGAYIVHMIEFDRFDNIDPHDLLMLWPEVLVCLDANEAESLSKELNDLSWKQHLVVCQGDFLINDAKELQQDWLNNDPCRYEISYVSDIKNYNELHRVLASEQSYKRLILREKSK